MKKEIEILAEVRDSKKKILQVLNKFTPKGAKKTVDVYYCDPLRTDLLPNNKKRLEKCFRIRNSGDLFHITYKSDYFNKHDIWQYSDEYVSTADHKDIYKIIDMLGLQVMATLRSTKHYYVHNNYEIVFEEVENLGNFIEVEVIKVGKKSIKKYKEDIKKFVNSFGLSVGEELNVGKPELYLRRNKKREKVFISYKLTGNNKNEVYDDILKITSCCSEVGLETYASILELEKISKKYKEPREIFKYVIDKLKNSDIVLIYLNSNKKSEGILLEVGYAMAYNKPVILLKKQGVKSYFVESIANKVINYKSEESKIINLEKYLKEYVNN